jgi:hypothetical protein
MLDPGADRHAASAVVELHSTDGRGNGSGRATYQPADDIETTCPLCVLEYRDNGWRHGRGCPLWAK